MILWGFLSNLTNPYRLVAENDIYVNSLGKFYKILILLDQNFNEFSLFFKNPLGFLNKHLKPLGFSQI
jgi:hypothetical protein